MLTDRWLPMVAHEFTQFQREIDRLFRTRWPGFAVSYPPLNVWEDDANFYVEAELPGLSLDKLEIFVADGNLLTIQGQRQPSAVASGTWHRQERGFGKFGRQVQLPSDVDANRVEAKLEQGVLRVTLPKNERARPRRIPVKGE
jgi:HSP20 family protein